jgi:hypothetical protein
VQKVVAYGLNFRKLVSAMRMALFKFQVKLLITNNAFCIEQRAAAQSITEIFLGYGVAEAPPGYQTGWSHCIYFSLSLFVSFAHLEFPSKEGTVPYRSSAQMSFRHMTKANEHY